MKCIRTRQASRCALPASRSSVTYSCYSGMIARSPGSTLPAGASCYRWVQNVLNILPARNRLNRRTLGGYVEEENHLDSSKGTRIGFASINGINMYFETKGEGKPLLLLHAGVADSRMWDNQFEEFSTTHFMIRCDLRGFGQSGKSSGRFAHYEDIAALLQYLNVEPVSVIGSSFGGYVAIDFVLAYPEMVTALILAAPALY